MPEQNTPGGESGRTGETRTPENLKAIRNHFHSVQLKEPAFAAFFKEVYDNEETLFRFQQMEQQLPRFLEQYDAPLEEPRTNDNSIQRLKPFWATVINRPEDRAHLKLALQEAARTQSERIKAQLRDAETSGRPFYVHALTIGAGDHSAIFAARVRAARPDAKILSVTSASVVGGQFAEYDGPALRMNTGVISTTEGGQKVNPNPFGPDAPVQVSDVSSSYIADSEVAGLVGGIDQYLSTLTAMGLEFSAGHYNPGYKPNRFDSTSNPKDFDPKRDALYVSDFKDVQTGETYHIYSDYLPDAAGLGEENWGIEELSTDEESQRVIDVQQKRGIGKSRILTYQQ